MTKPLGYSETIYSGGVPIIVRVDAHTWTTDAGGNVIAACTHGADIWVPAIGVATPAPATSSQQSTSNTLLVVSIGLGAIVSALSIWEFFRKR